MKLKKLLSISMLGLGLAHVPDALADDKTWTAQSGDALSAANWAGGLPGPNDVAVINNGGTATIPAGAPTIDLGSLILGGTGDESGHIIMNGGTLKIGEIQGSSKPIIGNGTTFSSFIMNGGTIFLDGPDQGAQNSSYKGLSELDWEVGERGMGRFEMHGSSVFLASDDLKGSDAGGGHSEIVIDGNARVAVGSGISVSGGAGSMSTMVIGGNALVEAGNSMGAGNPLGGTDEGYLTMASGNGIGTLTVQDNAIFNFRRLSAREGSSTIVVKGHGQIHIFEVLTGAGTNAATRPPVTGPNSTLASAGEGTLTLQDDAQMTVNAATEASPVEGLAIAGPRDNGNPGGKATFTIRDRASFRVEQDLGIGNGFNATTADGTLEVVGPGAQISIGRNLNLAVNTAGEIVGLDADGNPAPGKATLSAVITAATHSTVNVTGEARITNGVLKVKLSGYTPVLGNTFALIKGGTVDGPFARTDYTEAVLGAGLAWEVEYKPDAVNLKVVAKAAGRVLTVTTADNVNPGTGTSLVMALQSAGEGDTIAFNIPGAGPHFIKTPTDGYPLIIRNNVTVDGYTQPGSVPNTNSIHAPNSAKLMIVLDSREGGRTKMNYGTGRPGYGDSETAILGVFNAANVTIKGLGFLGLHTENSDPDPAIYCIAFARDNSGGPTFDDNGHVAGCWFGVEPNGTNVTGGSASAIAAFRHRDVSGGTLPELPNRNLTLGVKAGSANPRAEFNVMVGMSYHLAGEQIGARLSGNFIGVLPDGKTPYDMTLDGRPFAGASLEIGRYNDSTILIGTDGDGINDADEGNVFGPLTEGQSVLSFYSTGNKQFIIAGNYFGVAVDGVTAFPGSFQIVGEFGNASVVRFGSDFNGVSDALEGNLVVNNHPFPSDSAAIKNPIYASAGAKLSVRGNSFANNFPLPVNVGGTALGLNNPDPATFYTGFLVDPAVIQPVISSAGAELIGTAPVAAPAFVATIIDLYVADPEGIANGKSLNIAELPNGFVQGKTYVASFVDNSSADKDPAAGAFRFDIGTLSLGGANLTITANYSEQAPGTTNATVVTTPFSEPKLASQTVAGPGKPEDNGLTPKGATFYINVPPDAINNGRTESLGVAIANNGNVIVGWEDDGSDIFDLEAVWTLFDSNGASITTNTAITSLALGTSVNSKFLSYFRTDGTAIPGGTSWGPKIKANPFGDGIGMGATSFALGLEALELAPIQNNAAGENAGDFPSVQLLNNNGTPVRILSGVTDAYAETDGDIRIADWHYLGNGNIVIVGESRQGADLIEKYGGAAGGNHAIYRVLNANGTEVKAVSLVSEVAAANDMWHGAAVTANGFAIRFSLSGEGPTMRLFDNSGNPASTNINLAALTGNPAFGGGGRGDGVGFHGNGADAYVTVNKGTGPQGDNHVWVAVINADGTLRWTKPVTSDFPATNVDRVDAAIDATGRVLVVFDNVVPFEEGTDDDVRVVMGRLFDATGTPLGGTFYVSEKELPVAGTKTAFQPRVAFRNGLAAVAWESLNTTAVSTDGTPVSVVAARIFSVPGAGGGEIELSVAEVGVSSVTLEWTGGTGPFLLQKKGSFNDAAWMNVLTTPNRTASVPRDGNAGFFRVMDNATTQVTPLSAFLGGAFENPAVTTAATGLGTFSIEGNKLSYDISYTGLSGPATAAHIHGNAATTNNAGVLIAFTPPAAASGRITGTATLTEAQRTNILAGRTYANIHTALNGGGEIRGQIAQMNLKATLNGANEVPVVDTPATGSGTFTLVGNELWIDLSYTGLKGVANNSHIHGRADATTSAGVLVPTNTLHEGPFGTSGHFKGKVVLSPANLAHLIDGTTYFNIHSAAHGGGEIRGQIVP